ncbi:hypothetical protein AALB53_18330 [Lachnospiraceae bacterium 47-T17]
MADRSERIVDGFYFEDGDILREARKEEEGVRYMKARIDLEQPDKVLHIYRRMLEQKSFQTQVGYAYLRELQEYLRAMPQVANEDIAPITVHADLKVLDASGTTESLRRENKKAKQSLRRSVFLNIALFVVIGVIFGIALTSNSPTVLNYEKELVNRYAAWEQQLKERENAILEKERALNGDDD